MAKKEKTDVIFKALALVGLVVGGVSIAQAINTRIRRKEDEAEIEAVVTEAENFSGAVGLWARNKGKNVGKPILVNRPSTPSMMTRGVRPSRAKRMAIADSYLKPLGGNQANYKEQCESNGDKWGVGTNPDGTTFGVCVKRKNTSTN
jgi:hypothetical protein